MIAAELNSAVELIIKQNDRNNKIFLFTPILNEAKCFKDSAHLDLLDCKANLTYIDSIVTPLLLVFDSLLKEIVEFIDYYKIEINLIRLQQTNLEIRNFL